MTFEVGAVLEDEKWQAPVYCFDKTNEQEATVAASRGRVLDGLFKGPMQL